MAALIEGVVVGAGAREIAAASVYIVSAPVAMPDIAARTDTHGRFTITVPAPGDYTLGASAPGYATGSATVAVTNDAEPTAVTIALRPSGEP